MKRLHPVLPAVAFLFAFTGLLFERGVISRLEDGSALQEARIASDSKELAALKGELNQYQVERTQLVNDRQAALVKAEAQVWSLQHQLDTATKQVYADAAVIIRDHQELAAWQEACRQLDQQVRALLAPQQPNRPRTNF
jgi:protein subunit release factor A